MNTITKTTPVAVLVALGLASLSLQAAAEEDQKTAVAVVESARQLPVAYDVDVVVVGGSAGAVAAAAAEQGAKVFLAAPRHYLGEDICGTLRLWREPGEECAAPLAAQLYSAGKPATPLQIKKALDDALLTAKVEFLFGCFPSDVLVDERGTPCGVVMANRAGRQAVRAKVIVEATPQATIARLAGAKSRPWPAGPVTFRRVVIGGQSPSSPDVAQRKPPMPPIAGNARGAKKGTTAQFETVEYRSPSGYGAA